MRILIIEDDSLFSEILKIFFEDKQCEPLIANTLSDAKALLRVTTFDFVLLDNHLPDGDGTNFIDVVTSTVKQPTPLMMITGEENQNVMSEVFEKGADDYLVKPVSLDLLWQKVQRVRSLYSKEAKLQQQKAELDRLLNQRQQEEELARYVYEHIGSTAVSETACIETFIKSSSTFSGDVFISESAPNGNQFMILADATGHGLAAAISILPLIATIKAMIRKGLSFAHIVHEANTKLCKELPDDKFVALCGVEVNFSAGQLTIFNGGMPEILALKHNGEIEHLHSTTMALGILDPDDFEPAIRVKDATEYRNILLMSDGLTEQRNAKGQEYGLPAVLNSITKAAGQESPVAQIIQDFEAFNGQLELEDDLSMCDIQINALLEKHRNEYQEDGSCKTGKLSASISMSGGILSSSDIVGCFDGLMRSSDLPGDLRQRAFTVFAELISNAFDHGILGLDSTLKNDMNGFAEYIGMKEERMANLSDSDALEMQFTFDPTLGEILFSIKDSGPGYDMKEVVGMQDQALSGRGLPLINKLCCKVDVMPPGNNTAVTIKREC